ncbi:sushi, von Willebrand factor type A, EGF and pentraxin domain-containing protein 1-like [Mya arenaria]|uniref:sushi, von Willebrand factor type A, EGF and pentraxin domain-containing protein 1-like n=1 Tax=Mya arenaria TaxID=6604 RepID=UPI0022E31C59|nr:sushi, von Willebrand factor type A, EGF and pentraxin domain-containing protein 1-like [Mya arenaria]
MFCNFGKLCVILFFTFSLENNEGAKRGHSDGPAWFLHCWDSAPNHLMDPFCPPGCGTPPNTDNGYYNAPVNTSLNSIVVYTCNAGYYLDGGDIIMCNKTEGSTSPSWTKTPECKRKCGDIPHISNGSFQQTDQNVAGAVVEYTCDAGYQFSNWSNITCLPDGQWSEVPSCITEKYCLPLPYIDNGGIIVDNNTTNETATTTTSVPITTTEVADTTTTSGDLFITSEANNDTDNSSAVNENILVDELVNGTQESLGTNITGGFEPGAVFKYECYTGYSFRDTDTVTCTKNGTWTVLPECMPDCDVPPEVSNATITYNGTGFGSSALYTCDTDFYLIGPSTIYCSDNSTWSAPPRCVQVYCGSPVLIANGTTVYNSTAVGSTASYTCQSGFTLVGPDLVTCLENGTGYWSTEPECVIDCGEPVQIANGTAIYNTTILGSNASYTCQSGFGLKGTNLVTCMDDGYWTKEPQCATVCNSPPALANGYVASQNGLFVGDVVKYSCNGNFTLQGADVACLASGSWSTLPVCKPDCGPKPVVNYSMSYDVDLCDNSSCVCTQASCECDGLVYTNAMQRFCNSTDYEGARYVCNERFEMVGNEVIHCGLDFEWTVAPVCACVKKSVDLVFLIDYSGSVGMVGFNETKSFLNEMIEFFPIAKTRVGLMFFSDKTNVVFNLGDHLNDSKAMEEAISHVSYLGGATNTYDALALARESMFNETNGMRQNTSHIVILVSDGQSNNINKTVTEARRLRDKGVTIYTVGVGDYANMDELGAAASNPSYYFSVDKYENIVNVTGPLAEVTCSGYAAVVDD